MKRFLSMLLLFVLLLAPLSCAAPAGDAAVNLRIVYTVSSETLGGETAMIYLNAAAFPIARDDDALYLLTDASLYEFDTAVLAAADAIGERFEDAGITGLSPDEYAAEFQAESADIAVVCGGEVYHPVLMYASDTYALLMLSDVPDLEVCPYSETLPEDTVSYYSTQTPGCGISDAEPELSETLTLLDAAVTSSDEGFFVDRAFGFESLGSPLIGSGGVVCGMVYYDAAAEEIRGTGFAGLRDELAALGVTVTPVGGTQTPDGSQTVQTSGKTDASATSAVTTAAAETTRPVLPESAEELARSSGFRTAIIYATCIAGALLILIIVLLILRTRTARPDREVEKLRREEPTRESRTDAAPSRAAQTPPVRREPERARVPGESAAAAVAAAVRPAPQPRPGAAATRPVNGTRPENGPRPENVTRPVSETRPANGIAYDATRRMPETPPRSIMLTVLDGSLRGCTLNVSDTAVLGRDPKLCKLVFGATQTEISRRHCQVTYRPQTGEIILEDLNSANGTYTPDGRRYAAGRKYLLRRGDRFCLGTRENMVEVR
ncbi:MAG: FHA domain-containing protein [Eubacteriales bacterium]|nr:FHA domain-containing protein [Eubacteriales bacterium]